MRRREISPASFVPLRRASTLAGATVPTPREYSSLLAPADWPLRTSGAPGCLVGSVESASGALDIAFPVSGTTSTPRPLSVFAAGFHHSMLERDEAMLGAGRLSGGVSTSERDRAQRRIRVAKPEVRVSDPLDGYRKPPTGVTVVQASGTAGGSGASRSQRAAMRAEVVAPG